MDDQSVRQPFRRTRADKIRNKLTAEERAVIAQIFSDSSDLIMGGSERLWRLFPPRYNDPARQAAYELEKETTAEERVELVTNFVLCRTLLVDSDLFDEKEADLLLRSLSKLRLFFASLLEIDADDFELPHDAPAEVRLTFDIYNYTGWLLMHLIEAMDPTQATEQ
jgi:hypothetical protein